MYVARFANGGTERQQIIRNWRESITMQVQDSLKISVKSKLTITYLKRILKQKRI